MSPRVLGLGMALALLAGAALAAPPAPKKPVPQSPYAKDFVGTWDRVGSINFDPTIPFDKPDRPPLTPKAAAQFQASLDSAAAGKPINDPHANCIPLGMPRMMNGVYLMEVLVADEKVVVIGEEQSQVRRIWTDGRGFGDEIDPTYNGTSVGHWEGKTLVVETKGLHWDIPINQKGLMHSPNLTVSERFWLEDPNTLHDQITLTDPDTFATPWVVTKTFKRTKDPVNEYVCEENNRNPVGADGVTSVVLSSEKR
ncbi:MAG: hypothetical protein ACXU8Z_19750 [Caulobacteraceae bacterium]